jgi:hypothetical protein
MCSVNLFQPNANGLSSFMHIIINTLGDEARSLSHCKGGLLSLGMVVVLNLRDHSCGRVFKSSLRERSAPIAPQTYSTPGNFIVNVMIMPCPSCVEACQCYRSHFFYEVLSSRVLHGYDTTVLTFGTLFSLEKAVRALHVTGPPWQEE